MKILRIPILLFYAIAVSVLIWSCTESTSPKMHPVEWMDTGSQDFHGYNLSKKGGDGDGLQGIEWCKTCHGNDFRGGTANVSCYQCHSGGYSGHIALNDLINPDNPGFHGLALSENGPEGLTHCRDCHGQDLTGGKSGVSCSQCHQGGYSGHPAEADFIDPSNYNYHGKVLWDSAWDFSRCRNCHGSDLSGGFTGVACTDCHSEENGIGYCANCHGDRINGTPYPPLSIKNQSDPTLLSVGAHQTHMETAVTTVNCENCHVVPDNYLDDGHLGADNIAEVSFNLNYNHNLAESPSWDHAAATCTNVYCHGAFSFPKSESSDAWAYLEDEITGNNVSMVWNDPQGAECGTCHSLPPQGHTGTYTQTQCTWCHASVVDANGEIIDSTKHINGEVNRN